MQTRLILVALLVGTTVSASAQTTAQPEPDRETIRVDVTVDRGQDLGQAFGSLFEATSADGRLVVSAGFQNVYNTRYRADRHAIQFSIRPADGQRQFQTERLPRPNELTGTYLYARDGIVRSTYGGLRALDTDQQKWRDEPEIGGTNETMRLGDGVLEFGESRVKYNGRVILEPPSEGSYQLFFYARGHLCFYHVNRQDGPYRPYENDADGFSRLHACPWTPAEPKVDLSRSIALTLPVVGETTFAWGQLHDQIVTGSNIGGFYVFQDGNWSMLLEPVIGVSYQLYSTLEVNGRLLMGQYPTGRVFEYDGHEIRDQPGWPPTLNGVSDRAREAQTSVLYGGDIFVGVWPWGELWRYNLDSSQWVFMQRMFDHPELSTEVIHPYDVENQNYAVGNQWGQRVTSLVTSGTDLYIATSAKSPAVWEPDKFPFLADGRWQSYGSVYRVTMPGHLSAPTKWTDGPTRFEFFVSGSRLSIRQDGQELASTEVTGKLAEQLSSLGQLKNVSWGRGVYGRFGGRKLSGQVSR